MSTLPAIAERLAMCFASGRADRQTVHALAQLFPGANLVSMGVVAGGDVLITADNLVEEGCISVSFQRIDNTAAGTAILTHNRCHASCRTTRSGRYMDVDHAVRRWGCATFTSVPILSGLPSGSTASGPLVQAGMVALGALSIGTCSIVSNRQSTQLMTLACLASPFITPYVFGMVQDLSTIFLEPSLARCMCGPRIQAQPAGPVSQADLPGSCREDEDRQEDRQEDRHDASGRQALPNLASVAGASQPPPAGPFKQSAGELQQSTETRTREAGQGSASGSSSCSQGSWSARLVSRGQAPVDVAAAASSSRQDICSSSADKGPVHTLSENSVAKLRPLTPAGECSPTAPTVISRQRVNRPKAAASDKSSTPTCGADIASGSGAPESDSLPLARRRSSQIRTQRTGACHDVVLSKQLAVELDTSQSSWWLTFKSRELEAEFVKWKAAQQAKVDDLFSAVVGCMVFVMLFAPYYVLTYSLWPSMLFFLLPCVTRSISRRWNLRNRETVMAIVAMALTFATAQVAMPMFLEVLPAARVRTLAWRMRLLGAETIIIIPLGYMVRLRTFVPLQLVLVALMATNLPRVAPILLASTSFDSASLAAQAGLALVLAAVSYSVTIPIIRALETQSRQQFLSRLVAPIA